MWNPKTVVLTKRQRFDKNLEPTLINVWELGDTQHADLLKFGLNSGSLRTSVAVICLDLSYPWTLSESLSKWLQLLQTCVSSAANELAPGVWNQLKNQGENFDIF
jgi:hypothetical protein